MPLGCREREARKGCKSGQVPVMEKQNIRTLGPTAASWEDIEVWLLLIIVRRQGQGRTGVLDPEDVGSIYVQH